MILDTTFIIDLLKGKQSAVDKAAEIENHPIDTTVISVFEIFQGAKDSELPQIKKFFSQMTALPLTYETAERAGIIQQELREKGKIIDPEDCMIAAIALEHQQALITRNKKHFERITGLIVEMY